MKRMNSDAGPPRDAERVVYVGESMYPTLKALDILYVKPRQGYRRGDVIVFKDAEKNHMVTHRVVSVGPEGIRTRGDNCALPDPWTLSEDDVAGAVTSVCRGRRLKTVHGGTAGTVYASIMRAWAGIKRRILSLFSTLFHVVVHLNIFQGYVSKHIKFRLVRFDHHVRSPLYLYVGGTRVGRYLDDKKCWHIRPLFRAFVDEGALASMFAGELGSQGAHDGDLRRRY